MPPKKKQPKLEVIATPYPEVAEEIKLLLEEKAKVKQEKIKKLEYLAFMGAISHEHEKYVLDTLMEYDIGSYLISLEVSKVSHKETEGQHFHFVVQMTDEDYHKFSKRVFIDKFKLRGKALKDKPRQYGRVKQIESLERMIAYTLKDGNIRTNFTEEELEKYKAISFKKNENRQEQEIIIDYIKENLKVGEYGISRKDIGILIIHYHRTNKTNKAISKNYLQSLIFYYMMYHTDGETYYGKTDEEIYEMICG